MRATIIGALGFVCAALTLGACGAKPASEADKSRAVADATNPESWGGEAREGGARVAAAPARDYHPGDRFDDCDGADWCPRMSVIPGGAMRIGSPPDEPERYEGDGPQRQVSIRAFAMGRFEVTNNQWQACVRARACRDVSGDQREGGGMLPVTSVSWEDIQTYVRWLSQTTGHTYRLPSETEWEYAARAGTTTAFSTGATLSRAQANIFESDQTETAQARRVGSYPPNAFGLHDVHGNVSEIVQDCEAPISARQPVNGDPYMLDSCELHVVRGGSFGGVSPAARSASRWYQNTYSGGGNLGFRVAMTLPQS